MAQRHMLLTCRPPLPWRVPPQPAPGRQRPLERPWSARDKLEGERSTDQTEWQSDVITIEFW